MKIAVKQLFLSIENATYIIIEMYTNLYQSMLAVV